MRDELEVNVVALTRLTRAALPPMLERRRGWILNVEGPARHLLKHFESLWTFARVEGVEPTNNHAERELRRGVLWRKRSFGHQSERGRAFVERLLTVVGSLRLQGRNVLAYLEEACRAPPHRGCGPVPASSSRWLIP